MSTATITIEFDESTHIITAVASGDGEALEVANEMLDVYSQRDEADDFDGKFVTLN